MWYKVIIIYIFLLCLSYTNRIEDHNKALGDNILKLFDIGFSEFYL